MSRYNERILRLASYVAPGETVADIGPDHGYLGIWLMRNEISPRVIMTDIAEGPLAIARANVEKYATPALSVRRDPPHANTEDRCATPNVAGKESGVTDFRLGDGLAPHAAAQEPVASRAGVTDFRLGDGLAPLEPGEIDTVVIAGMGGETIIGILEADPAKTRSFSKYILQPRTKTELLRAWLNGSANKTSGGSSGELSEEHSGKRGEPKECERRGGFEIVAEDTAIERGRNCEIIVAETR